MGGGTGEGMGTTLILSPCLPDRCRHYKQFDSFIELDTEAFSTFSSHATESKLPSAISG